MKNVKLWQMVSTIHLSITRWGCFGWPTEHGSMLTKLIAAIGNTAVFVLHVCAVAMAAKRIREYLSVESPHLLKTLRPVFKLGFFSQTFFRSNNIGFLRNREGMDQSTVLSPNLSSNPKDHWTLQCQTLYVSGVHVFPQNRQFWGVLGYLGNTKLEFQTFTLGWFSISQDADSSSLPWFCWPIFWGEFGDLHLNLHHELPFGKGKKTTSNLDKF